MDVITEIIGPFSTLQHQIKQTDSLILTLEERLSPYMLGRTVGDRTIQISLARA